MALVDYSDSDDSGDEQKQAIAPKTQPKPVLPFNTKFAVDRSNPQKIQVKLNDTPANGDTPEDEPAPKRARIGGRGFSGFNAMLPPPKSDAEKPNTKPQTEPKKVFSLKTGIGPGFSRESDAELQQLFAEQDSHEEPADGNRNMSIPSIPKKQPKPLLEDSDPQRGNTFMFKPLSVARNTKKKKPANSLPKAPSPTAGPPTPAKPPEMPLVNPPPAKKVSLFSSGPDTEVLPSNDTIEPEDTTDTLAGEVYENPDFSNQPETMAYPGQYVLTDGPQSLDTIASDLNLSAAEKRQLFGRSGKGSSIAALNVVNFNTDREYAANEELRAAGEQVQHNPVRAIAPGKHSLKQLVNAAQGQKEALEESFAQGKRNKKEAGNKYGW